MKKTILIVDDERLVADSMAIFLNRSDEFSAVACYNLFDALEEGRTLKPDMVLFDVMRPKSKGVSDACRVRKVLKAPVLLMSGAVLKSGDMDCPAGDDGGPFQILLKPIPPVELFQQLKRFVETGAIAAAAV